MSVKVKNISDATLEDVNLEFKFYNKKGEEIITQSYDKLLSQGEFIENCVSRKKNVIPLIMDAIEG